MTWFERPEPELGTEGDVVWRRAAAVLIDIILVGIVSGLVGVFLLQERLAVFGGLLTLLLSFAYYIYLEGNYGQTIGKMALGIVVVTEEGDHIDYKAATLRTLLRVIDVLPVLYLVGIVVILITDRDQRIGDLIADTVVVRIA